MSRGGGLVQQHDRDPRAARAQPPQRRPGAAARPADRLHRAVGLGQVVARLRHHLRRGPAPLRRVACRRTRGSSSGRWTSPTSTSSKACRRRSRSTRSRRRATRVPPSAPSPRSTTTCGCSTRASVCRTAPTAGKVITRQTPQQIVDRVLQLEEGTRFQVLAPVVRGRKGEYEGLLKELATQGFTRARVDGELVELGAATGERLARYENHTIEVVVDRLVRRPGIERRLTDSLETALEARRRRRRGRDRSPRRRSVGSRDAHVLGAPRVHALRGLVRRARAAQLLVQLAVRRVRAVRRPRHPLRGRPRAPRPRRRPQPERRRDRAVVGVPQPLLRAGARSVASGVRLLHRHAVEEAEEEGQAGRPLRHRQDLGEGVVPQPLRTAALVHHAVRRRGAVARASPHRVGERPRPRADRGLHARGAVRARAAAHVCGRHRSRSRSAARTSTRWASSRSARRRSSSDRSSCPSATA